MNGPISFSRLVELPENRSAWLAIQDLYRAIQRDQPAVGLEESAHSLFLHGPPGTGKSALVVAAVHELADMVRALVTPAAQFDPDTADQLLQAELLAIEDLQHLPRFRAEGLVQLLDRRQARGKHTILTARQAPNDLVRKGEGLPSRLLSRLAQGLIIALEHWSPSSRLVFFQELGRRHQLVLGHDAWAWLAENIAGNGRQLEAALRQLQSLSAAHPYNLSFDMIVRHFQEQAAARRPTVDRIAHKVSGHFGVKARHLQS